MPRLCSAILLIFALAPLALPVASQAQIISITIAAPELPVYEQPAIPEAGYMWSPGYWAYDPDDGYFWVPGTWVLPPAVGLLWTPGYWGWRDGIYVWNEGYWGPHIGFYGGVYYGYGYGGVGYEGGYWNNGVFAYNQTVNNFGSVTITNVYSKTVIVNTNATRASFNGGTGGTTAQPTPQEQAAAHEQHVAVTPAQTQQQKMASTNKTLFASQNHGQPAIAATAKPGEFTGKGVVAAKEVKPSNTLPGTKPTGTGAPRTPPPAAPTASVKPAPVPPPHPAGPTPAAVKPAPVPPPHPAGTVPATVKPAPPPPHPAGPTPAAVKPAPVPPPHPAGTVPAKPNPPATAAVKPPPPAAARAVAKPACPPGKTMTPAGCK